MTADNCHSIAHSKAEHPQIKKKTQKTWSKQRGAQQNLFVCLFSLTTLQSILIISVDPSLDLGYLIQRF